MKKKTPAEIADQVEQTLKAFHTDDPPEMDPWFYERLSNRIEHGDSMDASEPQTWWNQVLKPGMLVGLVALNVVMIVWFVTPSVTVTSSSTDYISSLSTQYGLNFTDTYLLSDDGE